MARTTDRTAPLPYTPAPPPDGPLARAVWDEFYRIAEVLAQMNQAIATVADAQPAPPAPPV